MRLIADVISGFLMVTASFFVLLAALGLHRFDDVFSRIHAATKSVTFGVLLVAVGASLRMQHPTDVVLLLLAALLQLISSPVGSHILARAAYHAGGELSAATRTDELAQDSAEDPVASEGSVAGDDSAAQLD